jgi:hypothetical protein
MDKALQATYFNKMYTDNNPNHFLYLSGSQIRCKYLKVAQGGKQYRCKYSVPPAVMGTVKRPKPDWWMTIDLYPFSSSSWDPCTLYGSSSNQIIPAHDKKKLNVARNLWAL